MPELAREGCEEPFGGGAARKWSPEHRRRRVPVVVRGGERLTLFLARIEKNGGHGEIEWLTMSTKVRSEKL